jgi:hypothetical protein
MCLLYAGELTGQRASSGEDKCQSVINVSAYPAICLIKTRIALGIHTHGSGPLDMLFLSAVSCVIFYIHCILLYILSPKLFSFLAKEKLSGTQPLVRVFDRRSKERYLTYHTQYAKLAFPIL